MTERKTYMCKYCKYVSAAGKCARPPYHVCLFRKDSDPRVVANDIKIKIMKL